MEKRHLVGNAKAGLTLSNNEGVGVSSSAGTLADGSNNTVLSRVERIILSRLGLQLTNDLVQTRRLRNDELSHVKRLRSIAGVNLNDNLSNSSGVGDLVDHLNVEGSSLRTLGRVYGDALDGASSVVVVRAQVYLNTDPEGIRVSTKNTLMRRRITAYSWMRLANSMIPTMSQTTLQISVSQDWLR